jgi:hypothetical protein
MARKLKKVGFVTAAQLARKLNVSGAAVSQAIQSGRLVAFDGHGERVPPGFSGRKWFDEALAAEDWRNRRVRIDDGAGASDELVAAKVAKERLQSELLQMRVAREQGDLIPKAAMLAAMETLGRAVRQALAGISGWAEEIVAAEREGGVGAVSARLRAKFFELANAVADMIEAEAAAALKDDPGSRPHKG